MVSTGQIVILNGPSRAGKSTLARAVQQGVPGVWMHIGMDANKACTPPSLQPGVGLRPLTDMGQVNPWVEAHIPILFAALYESVAAHARLGLDVVMDINHHESYSMPYGILGDCARRLTGLPVLFVGVRCPLDVIWERRAATWGKSRDRWRLTSRRQSSWRRPRATRTGRTISKSIRPCMARQRGPILSVSVSPTGRPVRPSSLTPDEALMVLSGEELDQKPSPRVRAFAATSASPPARR